MRPEILGNRRAAFPGEAAADFLLLCEGGLPGKPNCVALNGRTFATFGGTDTLLMCYDVSFAARFDAILQRFPDVLADPSLQRDEDMLLHVQAQAHRRYPVVIFDEARYKLKAFEWGVIAGYMNTPEKLKKMRSQMCNARSEKIVDDHGSYWHRLRKTRCLIPATGIFEHREVKGFRNKIPYHVSLKGRDRFYLPGLYHYPHRADVETGEITGTFTLITRAANGVMAQVHNSGDQAFRMPLFLPEELETAWLLPGLSDEEMAGILDFKMPSGNLVCHPVYTVRTTKERPDGKTKIEAYDWPGLPPLGNDNGRAQAELF